MILKNYICLVMVFIVLIQVNYFLLVLSMILVQIHGVILIIGILVVVLIHLVHFIILYHLQLLWALHQIFILIILLQKFFLRTSATGDNEDSSGGDGESTDNGTTEENDSWFSKILSGIFGIADSILEGLAVPFNAIKEGINSIIEFFANLLDYLNPFSENFILLKLWNFLVEIISYINPFSENFFVYKLIELLSDLLKFLFVPENNPFDDLSSKFNEKFAFVEKL